MADQTRHYAFFTNHTCEYFPCHKGADRENFNCLFCYCPLYLLGENCGGHFVYLPDGTKDCSACLYPHLRQNYDAINARYAELCRLMPDRTETP